MEQTTEIQQKSLLINDTFQVVADSYCLILQEKRVTQEGENVGKEYWVNQSYHGNIPQLLHALGEIEVNKNIDVLEKTWEKLDEIRESAKKLVEIDVRKKIDGITKSLIPHRGREDSGDLKLRGKNEAIVKFIKQINEIRIKYELPVLKGEDLESKG